MVPWFVWKPVAKTIAASFLPEEGRELGFQFLVQRESPVEEARA